MKSTCPKFHPMLMGSVEGRSPVKPTNNKLRAVIYALTKCPANGGEDQSKRWNFHGRLMLNSFLTNYEKDIFSSFVQQPSNIYIYIYIANFSLNLKDPHVNSNCEFKK